MNRSVIISFGLHTLLVIITAMSLPFLAPKIIDLPPIVSVELIQITDKTNIPFAPKAKKIIEKVKKKEKKLVSEQAPPKKIKKIKSKTIISPDKKPEEIKEQKAEAIPLPEKKVEKIKTKEEKKQNPEKVENEVKQVSEFETKVVDANITAALIDKAKEKEKAEKINKTDKVTQDQNKNIEFEGLSLSESDVLKAQIFRCWSVPLGLPYKEDLIVRIKLKLKPTGHIIESEILDHVRMNRPGQVFYKVLAESALRALKMCNPLKVPTTGYERWKDMILNFDPNDMIGGG